MSHEEAKQEGCSKIRQEAKAFKVQKQAQKEHVLMVYLDTDKWVVMDTKTKEVVSEHPFKTDYEKGKAKEAALSSNAAWKSQQ